MSVSSVNPSTGRHRAGSKVAETAVGSAGGTSARIGVVPPVYAIPLRTRFRGITLREGVLLHGDAGWGEFSPFLDYGPDEAQPWLRAARDAADEGWPEPR